VTLKWAKEALTGEKRGAGVNRPVLRRRKAGVGRTVHDARKGAGVFRPVIRRREAGVSRTAVETKVNHEAGT
jgi:hypothetical protein